MLHQDVIDSSYIILVACMHFSIYSEMNSVEIQKISDLTFSFLEWKTPKMLVWIPFLGWAKNQCSACN